MPPRLQLQIPGEHYSRDSDIDAAIQEAQTILELQDDWDGEGSPGYAESTLRRAIDFLLLNTSRAWECCGIRTQAPVIGPGPDGSIDIHWKTSTRKLLVNIPADSNKAATFYGDDRTSRDGATSNVIEGCLDTAIDHLWLLMWLAA